MWLVSPSMTDGEAPFDESDIASLASKLATLALTDREQAALKALIVDEVAGYAGAFDVGGLLGTELTGLRTRGVRVFGIRAGTTSTGVRARSAPGESGRPRPL